MITFCNEKEAIDFLASRPYLYRHGDGFSPRLAGPTFYPQAR